MVENNMTVKVTNRDNGSVGYSVPDLGVHRTFQPRESKEISAEELRKLSYLPGGDVIIRDYLIIHNNPELLKELLGEVEPEYYYSEEEVKALLLTGSLEQLQDCLDFAPNGVIDLIKSLAVSLKIDNVSKRKAIQDKTGFNVTRAIEINEETDEETASKESAQGRRAAPITAKSEEAQQRRSAPPKYNVVSQK